MSEIRTIPPRMTRYPWNALVDHGLEKTASYIIRSGSSSGLYEAINGSDGTIDYSGSNASAVIQATINALTSGIIFVKAGDYTFNSAVAMKSHIKIIGEVVGTTGQSLGTRFLLPINANYSIFTGSTFEFWEISNIYMHGNGDNGATSNIIDFTIATEGIMNNVRVINAGQDGINLVSCEHNIFSRFTDGYCLRYGIRIVGGGANIFENGEIVGNVDNQISCGSSKYNRFDKLSIESGQNYGAYFSTDYYNVILDCHFYRNKYHGIQLYNSTNDYIQDCIFEENSVGGAGQGNGISLANTTKYCWVQNNKGIDVRTPKLQYYLLELGSGTTYCIVTENDTTGNYVSIGMDVLGTGHIIKNNIGYITENFGTTTISANSGSFLHGLSAIPKIINLAVSGSDYAGALRWDVSGSAGVWVAQTGSGTVGFSWEARV